MASFINMQNFACSLYLFIYILIHNSPQKQSSGRSWIIISSALLFGAIGATMATMGIIPEIAAIGVIATVVLSGIAGTIVGGVAGYLVNVAINQCCGACSSVVQE
ncbi:hypothetical protein [Wolbachia endosymbiont (group A) of Portevinia maculata]|uniref:hypothetical protein n=4 Tax=unclassified Wolbachia TaxID=2640676 RepID=UPI00397ACB8D